MIIVVVCNILKFFVVIIFIVSLVVIRHVVKEVIVPNIYVCKVTQGIGKTTRPDVQFDVVEDRDWTKDRVDIAALVPNECQIPREGKSGGSGYYRSRGKILRLS